MRDESSIDPTEPPLATEDERIRRFRVAELKATLDRIGAEAKTRGLTEEILNDILRDRHAPTFERRLNSCQESKSEIRII